MTDKPEAPATIRADGFQEQCAPFVMPGYILVVIYLGKLLSRTGPGPVRDNNFPKYIYGQDKVGIALRHRSSHGQGLLFGFLQRIFKKEIPHSHVKAYRKIKVTDWKVLSP